jgi:hypothetical protein
MLKKFEAKCKRCRKEFCKKRIEQDYCSAGCRKAAWSDTKKRRLMPSRRAILGSALGWSYNHRRGWAYLLLERFAEAAQALTQTEFR